MPDAARSHRESSAGLVRAEWLWLAALVLLVSFHFWFPWRAGGAVDDSYSTRAEGKKAFFRLIERLGEIRGIDVFRSETPFTRSIAGTPAAEVDHTRVLGDPVLCLLGPARYPTEREWDRLLAWVRNGGTLLIAARDEQPELTIEALGIEVQPAGAGGDDGLTSSLVPAGDYYWQSYGVVEAPAAQTLVESGGRPQAVLAYHGVGRVIVVASEFVFTNQSLAWGDNAQLALALLLMGANLPRQIVIDESLNVSGTPRVVGLLIGPLLRPVTVQLLIVLVLFAWWGSRRFGPLLAASVPARQNIVDHTDAVGIHAWQARDGAGMVRAYLRQLSDELKLRHWHGQEQRVLEPIAARLGRPVEVVQRLLEKAEKAAGAADLDRRTAAAIIQRLAVVRRAARERGHARRQRAVVHTAGQV
ncbi:MAG: DUF4350 domain-containing protein [Planctomycetes bacterium]|nr:DUF4350 domain-containing protein [Planctomycetota bacterium]